VGNRIRRAISGASQMMARLRKRSVLLDHVLLALKLYSKEDGSRLAAAIAFYGCFATFALLVLLFGALGKLTGHQAAENAVENYVRHNLPLGDVHVLVDASRRLSAVAVVGLVLAGIWWVEALRSSQRALWHLPQHPGNLVIRYLVDLAVLVGLGLLLMVSLAISLGLQDILLALAGDASRPVARHALTWSSALLAAAVDFVLAAALLAGVPRLHMSLRRLLPSALIVVVGLGLLKSAGRWWYSGRLTSNPAYQITAGTLALLVFIYVLHQIILLATALAATSDRGTVRDLAAGPPPKPEPSEPEPSEPEPSEPQ
jgi:membrane protein